MYLTNIKIFGTEFPNTLTGLIQFIGRSDPLRPIGITSEAMIKKLHLFGAPSINMLDALTSLVKLVEYELLLTLKLVMLLIALLSPIVVTALVSVATGNTPNAPSKWRPIDTH